MNYFLNAFIGRPIAGHITLSYFPQVLHTWNNKIENNKVRHLVQEMSRWQKEGYLDRSIWTNINFPSNLSPIYSATSASHIGHTREPVQASDLTESKGKMQGVNSSGPQKTQSALSMSQRQHRIFKNENLQYSIWEPKLCQYFGIADLKFLKEH